MLETKEPFTLDLHFTCATLLLRGEPRCLLLIRETKIDLRYCQHLQDTWEIGFTTYSKWWVYESRQASRFVNAFQSRHVRCI